MKKIGILSDTHGFIDASIYTFFAETDEIWHAGDIGNSQTAEKLSEFKKLRAVYGNIDDANLRQKFKRLQVFECERLKVMMSHIIGYPGKYNKSMIKAIDIIRPDVVVAGHSHILRIQYDRENNFLFINPGAAGRFGLQKKITLVRMEVDGEKIQNMEIFEKEIK